jgi:hypothetical protein
MAFLYLAQNGGSNTTAAPVKVTTSTSIKTMLQVVTVGAPIKIVEWGISFDGSAAATPIECELITTGSVAATVTSFTPTKYSDSNAPASSCVGSSSGTGFTASAEGTVTSAQIYDMQLVAPTNQYVKQFPLGREPYVPGSTVLRVRVTAGTAVNAYTYVIWEE